MKKNIIGLAAALLLAACGQQQPETANTPLDIDAEARRIAMSNIIVDTHIDVPYRVIAFPQDISGPTESGDFDYPRARAGGLNAPFMSIYTPAQMEGSGESKKTADKLIDLVEGTVAASPDKFAIAAGGRSRQPALFLRARDPLSFAVAQ
jgi:membrane dipeptidase